MWLFIHEDTQMEYVTCVAIILKLSVTCFSNEVKYNTYGKFALKNGSVCTKWAVKSHIHTSSY